MTDTAATWVGRALPRFEDRVLLRGAGRFTADLPAALHARFVRSPVAAGRIRAITAPDGTHLTTGDDLDRVAPIQPILTRFGYIPIRQHVLARDIVRYVGEPVAVVLAATAEAAEDIAEAVLVDIDATDCVTTAEAARAPGAPLVHSEAAGNVVIETARRTDGFDAATARASRRVDVTLRSHRQAALPIECRAAHAAFDRDTGRVTLTCTTQMPHLTRTAIADLLAMPESDLRVIAPQVGGGFGQKMSLAAEYVVLVWLARAYRTSVAWAEDRRENLMASFHARDMTVAVTGHFDAEARLIALAGDVTANCGAYAPFPNTAAVEPLMSLAELPGPYAVADYACTARAITTHTCPSAPYRGVARPVITAVMERLMDRAAAAFGLPPEDIRRRNLVTTFPHVTPTGLTLDAATYVETMDAALALADLPAFRVRQAAARDEGRLIGAGLSVFCERTGYGSAAFAQRGMGVTPGWETVALAIDPGGHVEARIGASPHGQGLATTLAQIIADAVGTTPDRVRIIHGDTDRTPYGWGSFASRGLVIAGGACRMAGQSLHRKLRAIAAHVLEASEADIMLRDGTASVVGTDRTVPLAALARRAHLAAHTLPPGMEPGLEHAATYDPNGTFSNACHIAFVEIDPDTYLTRCTRFIVAEDAGRLINPAIVDGQIRGGVAQGIAGALLEEIVYDPGGDILSTTLADFLPPTAHEIPPIEILHQETISPETITGAKGLGEGGTIGAPAAVLNAINDAIAHLGVSTDSLPVTPLRLRAALRA